MVTVSSWSLIFSFQYFHLLKACLDKRQSSADSIMDNYISAEIEKFLALRKCNFVEESTASCIKRALALKR